MVTAAVMAARKLKAIYYAGRVRLLSQRAMSAEGQSFVPLGKGSCE